MQGVSEALTPLATQNTNLQSLAQQSKAKQMSILNQIKTQNAELF